MQLDAPAHRIGVSAPHRQDDVPSPGSPGPPEKDWPDTAFEEIGRAFPAGFQPASV
jgi:hypothetical protein